VKRKLLGFIVLLFLVLGFSVVAVFAYIVGGVSSSTTIDYPFQRKIFYANGRFWVWDSDGTNLEYRTSVDGSTWTADVDVRACSSGSQFSVWFDGTYMHYAVASGSYIYYRRGTPNSDGSITWSAAEQSIYAESPYRPFVSVDSNGYPWIVYYVYSISPYPLYALKSSKNDGTWTTASQTLLTSAFSGNTMCGAIVPLTNGKMLALYTNDGVAVSAKYWDGSAWGTAVSTTSSVQYAYEFSAVAQGDDVHLVFLKATTYDIIYTKYSYASNSFSAETILQAAATSTSAPVISINPKTNDLYVFAATTTTGTPTGWTANHIYCKKYTASNGTWSSWVDWFTPSTSLNAANKITSAYGSSLQIGFACLTSAAAPYLIEFSSISFNTPPDAPTLSAPTANYCFNPNATANFTWTFNDPDPGDYQTAYEILIINEGGSTVYDSGKVAGGANTLTLNVPNTAGRYYWKVKVWDSQDAASVWSEQRQFFVDVIDLQGASVNIEAETLTIAVRLKYLGSQVGIVVKYAGVTAATNGSASPYMAVLDFSSVSEIPFNSLLEVVQWDSGNGIITANTGSIQIALEKKPVPNSPFNIRATNPITNILWVDVEKKLSFTTNGTCVVKVGDWGSPLRVEVDGVIYTNWTYNSVKQEVIIYNLASNVTLCWQELPSGGVPGGGVAPIPTPPPPPVYVPPEAVPLVNIGLITIVAIVVGAYLYSEVTKPKTTRQKWSQRQKNNKPVKWKRRGRFEE